jgi:TonB family protein
MKVMKYLLTLLLFVVSTAAISQDRYSYFIKDANYNRFIGVKIQVIHSKSQKINQEQISDSSGAVQFERFNRKTHQLRAIIKDNLHLDSTMHSAQQYGFQINGTKKYYDSIRYDEFEKFQKSISHYTKAWAKIDVYYDSISENNQTNDSIAELQPNSKIGEKNIKTLPIPKYNQITFQPYEKFSKYIDSNINYPEISRDLGDEGKVYVEFILHSDGIISHVKIVRGVSDEIDFEVIRVIRSVPFPMEPCKQDGKPVDCFFTLPIIFKMG